MQVLPDGGHGSEARPTIAGVTRSALDVPLAGRITRIWPVVVLIGLLASSVAGCSSSSVEDSASGTPDNSASGSPTAARSESTGGSTPGTPTEARPGDAGSPVATPGGSPVSDPDQPSTVDQQGVGTVVEQGQRGASSPGTPGKPTGLSGRGVTEGVIASWTAPRDSGGTLSGYRAFAFDSNGWPSSSCDAPATETTCTLGSLTPGATYTVSVRALSSVGAGPMSDRSAPVRAG